MLLTQETSQNKVENSCIYKTIITFYSYILLLSHHQVLDFICEKNGSFHSLEPLKRERLKGVGKMEYDHLIVTGMNYRRTKEDIMKDVKADAAEWYDKELNMRLKTGGDRGDIVRKLDVDTKNWIDLEFQRRMNWNYEEEGTAPLE